MKQTEEWMERAACREHETPGLWFPADQGTRSQMARVRQQAIDICVACPVRQDCYQHARDHKEGYGVWGGVDFEQRTNKTPMGEVWSLVCIECTRVFEEPAAFKKKSSYCSDMCREISVRRKKVLSERARRHRIKVGN